MSKSVDKRLAAQETRVRTQEEVVSLNNQSDKLTVSKQIQIEQSLPAWLRQRMRWIQQSELDAAKQELQQENERLRAGIRDALKRAVHLQKMGLMTDECWPDCPRCRLESLLTPTPGTETGE